MGRLPTIPEYYRDHINKNVDLALDTKQCCPFHHEDTPSFSYSPELKRWRCFGACKTGGGVVKMHMMKNRGTFATEEEALISLKRMYNVQDDKLELSHSTILVNKDKIETETTLQKAYILANKPDRWVELDYEMSIYPLQISRIEALISKWAQS